MPAAKKETEAVKKTAKKAPAKKTDKTVASSDVQAAAEAVKKGSFLPAVGRRKSAVARVRLIKNGRGAVTVNGKELSAFFGRKDLQEQVVSPLKAVGQDEAVDVSAKVLGGGVRGQAESVRLGIARALCEMDAGYRTTLKKLGYLSRDPRVRERKKPGKRGARRSPQWSKR